MTGRVDLIIASTLDHAFNSAVIDWQWQRVGPREFELPDGTRALYVFDRRGRASRGWPRGTRVYIGHAASERDDWPDWLESFRTRGLIGFYPFYFGPRSHDR